MKTQIKAGWMHFKLHGYDALKKMAIRTIILAVLTMAGLTIADMLVESGMSNRFSLVRRFPEFIPMIMAAAKFTFIEMSLVWIQYATRPRPTKAERSNDTMSMNPQVKLASANVMYVTNAFVWAFRVAVFIYLMG